MIRRACVAGQFYPGKRDYLKSAVGGLLKDEPRLKAVAVVAPHAGYIYSGAVAAEVYSTVEIPDNVILIGPNHTGYGKRAAVMAEGEWETPLGKVSVNAGLAREVIFSSPLFSEDAEAHLMEHSLEVQLPFIQSVNPEATIVPVTVMHAGLDECEEMGRGISSAISSFKGDVLIVVSSDMNHYEPEDVTRKKDGLAIEAVERLDHRGLFNVTGRKDITMCGVIPATIALFAAKELKAKEARLIKYATSGDTSGDHARVVGYAGFVIR